MTGLQELFASRELAANLVRRELKSKYKATLLGWFWSLVNPLAQVVIFTFVAMFVFKVKPEPGANGIDYFPIWVLSGIIPWNYFVNGVNQGVFSLIGNANLIQKSYFPRALLVLSATLALGVSTLIEVAVLLAVVLALGVIPFAWLPLVAYALVLLWCFTTGVALILGIANVYFRDITHLLGILFQMWFYLTPVIYPVETVRNALPESWMVRLYELNPMYHPVEILRQAVYYQARPSWVSLGYFTLVALGTLVLGWLVFCRFEPRLAEEL